MRPALILEGISKTYQGGRLKKPDLRSSLTSWWIPSKRDKEEFCALQDINLAIGQVEIVGIIGQIEQENLHCSNSLPGLRFRQKKCMDKLMDVSGQGRTIIMVSHQLSYLKNLCQTGVYLNSGKL